MIVQGLMSLLFVVFAWGPLLGFGGGVQTFNLRLADGLLPLTVAGCCLLWLAERRLPLSLTRLRTIPLLATLLLFVLLVSASLLVAVGPLTALRRVVRVWLLLMLAIGVIDFAPSLTRIRWLLALHVLVQATLGLAQYWWQRNVGLRWLGEQEMRAELGFNIVQTADRIVLRAQGLSEHPNLFAITLVVPLLIVLGGFAQASGWGRWLWLGVLFLGTVALFFAFSRAATLGGVLGACYFVGLRRWGLTSADSTTPPTTSNRFILIFTILALLTLTYINHDVLLTRINPSGSVLEWVSVNERIVQNLVGLRMVQAAPLLGVGAGNGRLLFLDFLGDEPYISRVIHNAVLLISAETGLLNGILWFIILLTPPIYGILHRRTLSTDALALSAALIPYLITDFTSPASWDTPVGSLLRWLVLALWLRAVHASAKTQTP